MATAKALSRALLSRLPFAFYAVICACGGHRPPRAPPPVPVEIAPVSAGPVARSSEYLATVRSRDSAVIAPLVSGYVTRIFVHSGDTVRTGTPLVEIDPRRQRATYESSSAAARAQVSELERARSTLEQMRADRASRRAAFDLARANEVRDAKLLREGAISASAYDQTHAGFLSAQAALEGADAAIVAQRAAVQAAKRGVSQASATARSQYAELQFYRVSAPADGVVGDIPVRVGDYVSPQTAITSVTGRGDLEAYIPVPVERAADLHPGEAVELRDATGELLATSRLFFVAPEVNADSQTVLAKAKIDAGAEPHAPIKASQVVRARVIWSVERGLRVPVSAITRLNGQPFVFVVEPGAPARVHQQPVTLGPIEDDRVVVEKGLREGQDVVVAGAQKLREGAIVQPGTGPRGG